MKTQIKNKSIFISSKHLLLLCFAIFNTFFPYKIKAQLPAPSNFHYYLEYFHISESGSCGGKWLIGPAYCSYFQWNMPDTTGITNQIDYYKIYNVDFYLGTDTTVIATVSDTSYIIDDGYEGSLWVTAVYKDSSMESNPSNIEINEGLPIKIQELKRSKSTEFYYNRDLHTIKISDISKVNELKIYDIYGKMVVSKKINSDIFQIPLLSEGFYIIKLLKNQKTVETQKIIY